VKVVDRPGGRTAKAEADDARDQPGHAARAALRREAERLALEQEEER
jgi:pyridinium-3,5-bisthiocarboxylic acid mononucleotide nickel chelatase